MAHDLQGVIQHVTAQNRAGSHGAILVREIERLRTEVFDARAAGFASAQKQAANIARLYESELRRMAVDSWMFDPARRGDFSPEAQAKSLELGEEGWRKGEAAMAAENIAGAIDEMEETTDV